MSMNEIIKLLAIKRKIIQFRVALTRHLSTEELRSSNQAGISGLKFLPSGPENRKVSLEMYSINMEIIRRDWFDNINYTGKHD